MNTKLKIAIMLSLFFITGSVISNINVDSLLKVADTSSEQRKANIYIDIAKSYYGVSVDEYFNYSLKAKHFAELAADEPTLNAALLQLGIAYHFSGKPDSAIYNYKRALEYTKKQKDTAKTIKALRNIGISYQDIGLYTKANDYYKQAYNLAELSHDSLGMVYVLSSIATAYNSALDFNSSVETSLKALEIAEKNNYSSRTSNILNSLSITFGMMEDYEKALYYQRKSLLYIDNEIEKREAASSYSNIGLIYKKMGMYDSAEYNYNISLKLKKEIGDINRLATIYDNIGSLHLVRKQYQKALDIYFEGLKFVEESNLNDQIMLITDIGEVYYEMGNFSEADIYFQRGLRLSEKGGSTERLTRLYENLYKTNKAAGNSDKALYYSDRYHAIKDSVFDIEKQKQLIDIETKYQTEKKENEILLLTKEKELQEAEIQKQRVLQYTLAGLILLFLIVAILFFSRYRLKQKSIRNKLEKDKFETEGKLLRSQMNPHFIFNSLNSIQSFISSNEPFKAMTYLSKFGKLTRDILEYSRESFITLDEEISSLKLYIELETLRFKDDIRYNINVDENIDIEATLIPPIIVQPFVENALKHGLRQKQGEGLLEINFRIEHDKLLCTISDNGIGRKASMLNKDKDHHSLGIQITTERLQNLNRKAKSDIRFAITDLYDNSGTAVGTKVVITLPKKVI